MSGNEEIKFTRNGQTAKFKVGKKYDSGDKAFRKNKMKALEPLFDAIVNSDGNQKISEQEFMMIKKLKTIFEKTGDNTDNILDTDDMALADEYKNSKLSIDQFLDRKLKELTTPTPSTVNQNASNVVQEQVTEAPKKSVAPAAQTEPQEVKKPEEKKKPAEPTVKEKLSSFNRGIQNQAKRFDKDELGFTQEVEIKTGMPLYNVAKKALQDEGVANPTQRQINERLAQIVAANPGLKDVNNVKIGTKLKVGKGISPAGRDTSSTSPAGRVTSPAGGEGVTPPTSEIKVSADPDTTGWTETANTLTPEEVDPKGGTLKTYTQGEGAETKTKYVYEREGVRFESANVEDLKSKIATLDNALAELGKTVDGETAEAKQARIAKAVDDIASIGTESAVKKAQEKLVEKKADVAQEAYAQKTIAMLQSMNPALIAEMVGENGVKFEALVNNNPEVQKAVGDILKYLNDKVKNDEYLTLDEQAVKATLEKCINKDGVKIDAKAAVAEVKNEDGSVTTPAQAEVFEKTMVTDPNGNSVYKSTAKIGNDNVEFRANDDKVLDEFLAELKAADTDEKKTALFKKYAESCADTELLKSIAQKANRLKGAKDDIIALINKSNLDVVYAINATGLSEDDKKAVMEAYTVRIQAIIDNPELSKLPENAKYLEKVKELDISQMKTDFIPYLDGYSEATGDGATQEITVKDANGNDVKVTVTKYVKEGEPDRFGVLLKSAADEVMCDRTFATAQEAAEMKVKHDALALTQPEEGAELTAEQKRENLEKLIQQVELYPEKWILKDIAVALHGNTLIDKNDPKAKELVQKLLLTRDADVVISLMETYNESELIIDNTLFENDPVALKTAAAMFKELRDKEKRGEKLTQEEIALKDKLDDAVVNLQANIDNGNKLRFDGEGNLAVYNADDSGDNSGAVTANSANAERYEASWGDVDKVLSDPVLSNDKAALATLITTDGFSLLTKDQLLKLINLDTVDAELLSYFDWDNLNNDMSAEDKKAVQDAYVEKAKKLFTFETPAEGAKLDPSNARYLKTILDEIDAISAKPQNGEDPDKAVIDEILANFFAVSGEGDNQTTTIKDFRRFTYEEMDGLARAVAQYGTDAQKSAIANMITQDEMEDGQFVRAIEFSALNDQVRAKYAEFVDSMTTSEEVIGLIDKMGWPSYHIPFDKVMEKFGDKPEVINKLLQNYNDKVSSMSAATRIKLVKSVMSTDNNGNYVFDKSKLPDGVDVQMIIYLLWCYDDAVKSDMRKLSKAVFMTLDLSNEDLILFLNNNVASGVCNIDDEMKNKIVKLIDSDAVKKGTQQGNEFVDWLANRTVLNNEEMEKLYNNATAKSKSSLINGRDIGYNNNLSDSHVVLYTGDSIDKIVKNYLKKHLELFPQLKKSVESDPKKWTEARIEEALNDYMNDFRDDICKDLGISDPTKLKAGDIVELGKIKWGEYQPGWWNYNINY